MQIELKAGDVVTVQQRIIVDDVRKDSDGDHAGKSGCGAYRFFKPADIVSIERYPEPIKPLDQVCRKNNQIGTVIATLDDKYFWVDTAGGPYTWRVEDVERV